MKVLMTIVILLTTTSAMSQEKTATKAEPGTRLSQSDQLRADAQEICPVSGKRLGSMGTPIKRKIGKQELFLCCKGCTKGKVNKDHWGAIHKNIKQAQSICPVMGKPLPVKSKWTIVEGRLIYVCCPPCIEKIQREPAKWLSKVDQQYAASRNPIPDAVRIAAQQICPVSGKTLGSMGVPIKTRIGREDVFLCCKACTKGKVNKSHWNTIHANFRKAQNICPIMGKPLPPKAKWTIVNGQIVYVCCAPCTKKIESNVHSSLTRIAAEYAKSAAVPGK